MITYKAKYDSFVHYRVDKMESIKLADTGDKIKTLFTSPENFNGHCVEVVGNIFGRWFVEIRYVS